MTGRRVVFVELVLTALAGVSAGCASAMDPFTSGPAHASVTGLVTASTGTPLAETMVDIACAGGGPTVRVTTDSTGHYLANLVSGSDPFDGGSGQLRCHFTEPATARPRGQADTALGFVRGPVLVALQFVNIPGSQARRLRPAAVAHEDAVHTVPAARFPTHVNMTRFP